MAGGSGRLMSTEPSGNIMLIGAEGDSAVQARLDSSTETGQRQSKANGGTRLAPDLAAMPRLGELKHLKM